ncbi:MAG: DUF2029 domain-containing protein [Phycisphaerae bacterium]|nr:DUF2029 domain-containing protein [Phycisphaerae bacterium]
MPKLAPTWIRWTCLATFAMLAVGLFIAGIEPARKLGPDFEYFYKAGRVLLVHGTTDPGYDRLPNGQIERRGTIEWYPPCVGRIMTLFAWLPGEYAGLAWLTLNVVAMLACVRLIARNMMGLPPRDWPVVQLLPFLLLLPAWWWEFRLNQINNFTLLLLVASYVLWRRGQHTPAGFWLGIATILKLTPIVVLGWFVLKRQFRVVAIALLTIMLAGPVADAIVFGPKLASEHYATWAQTAISGSHRHLILSQREMDWRNQASGAVLCRWLHQTNISTTWYNDPRWHDDPQQRFINIANLPLGTVAMLHTALAAALVLGLVWLARRPASALNDWQLRFEWALFTLAMLWLMPVMRRYHVVMSLPAISVLAAALHYAGPRGWWSRLAQAGVALVALTDIAVIILVRQGNLQPVEAGGIILAATMMLGLPLVAALLWLWRNPRAIPSDPFATRHAADQAET